jgi:hypothetical protein
VQVICKDKIFLNMFLPEKNVDGLYSVVLKLHHMLCDVLDAKLQQHTF